MYKIKLFSSDSDHSLELSVNEWLQVNKDILIHSSNLTGGTMENLGIREFHFYILYTGTEHQAEELKEMAAAVTQEQSLEVKDINPEILKPSS